MRSLIVEVPPHKAKSLEASYKFIEGFQSIVNGFNLTDMALGRVTVDNCALVAGIRESLRERIISTISVGHRDITANRSYMEGLSYLGIRKAILVQGPSGLSKVSQMLPYAMKAFNSVGAAVASKGITEKRISANVSFFVTQMYGEEDVQLLGRLGFRGEVLVSVPAFDDIEAAKRLSSRGFYVPEGIMSSSDPGSSTRITLLNIMDMAKDQGMAPSAYIVPLEVDKLQKWLEDIIKNM